MAEQTYHCRAREDRGCPVLLDIRVGDKVRAVDRVGMRLLSCSERRIAVETKIRKGKENAEESESVNESK